MTPHSDGSSACPPAIRGPSSSSAARTEFAAHGFPGAGVDRIARPRRREQGDDLLPLRQQDRALSRGHRPRASPPSPPSPDAAVDRRARRRASRPARRLLCARCPHGRAHITSCPLMLREIGGRRPQPRSRRDAAQTSGIFGVVRDVLESGAETGEFGAMHPLLTHFVILGASMLYIANEPLRQRIRRMRLPRGPGGACRHRTVPAIT